ncbi:MAG: hypothetical protein WA975_03055 [Mesorhizobium sp.]
MAERFHHTYRAHVFLATAAPQDGTPRHATKRRAKKKPGEPGFSVALASRAGKLMDPKLSDPSP